MPRPGADQPDPVVPVTGPAGRVFVVMSGLPGSGKTTLGRGIAVALGVPLLDKDEILEPLLETLATADPDSRQRLSRASDAVLQSIAMNTPAAVLCSFWRRERLSTTSGTPTDWLRDLQDARLVEVYCACSVPLAVQRFQARRRHPGHHDGRHTTEDLIDQFTRLDAEGPLGIGVLIRADTGGDADPAAIAAVVVRHLGKRVKG